MTLSKNKHIDVLIFVEDPSVANYILPLPEVLDEIGLSTKIFASGIAVDYLDQRNIAFNNISVKDTPEAIIASYNPRCLLAGTAENLDTIGLLLIKEAKKKKIPTIGIVDAFMNAEKRFSGHLDDALAYAPDWILVPDESVKILYDNLGFPDKNILICGHPQYDHVRELSKQWRKKDLKLLRKKVFPHAKENQTIIVFISEGSVRNKPLSQEDLENYTLKGRGKIFSRTEIVLEELIDALNGIGKEIYLVLRIHPKDLESDFDNYKEEVNEISSGGNPLELIFSADLIIGMTSMLLTEAVIMGKKTLSIIPTKKELDWLPSVRNGIAPFVQDKESLYETVFTLLSIPEELNYNINNLDKFVFGSKEQIIKLIKDII